MSKRIANKLIETQLFPVIGFSNNLAMLMLVVTYIYVGLSRSHYTYKIITQNSMINYKHVHMSVLIQYTQKFQYWQMVG